MRHPRKRDANERSIILALRGLGATVVQLDGTGLPDLLVGYQSRTYLAEVKQEHGRSWVGGPRSDDGLLPSQREWWATWKGARPAILTTPEEALEWLIGKEM